MNLINISIEQGMQSEPFINSRQILEQSVRNRSKPYFIGIQESPLSFKVRFAFDGDPWDSDSIREIARWLKQDSYKELYFTDNTNRRFWAIVVEDSTLIHNMLKQGMIELTFRCSDSYSYSPLYLSSVIKTSTQDICATGTSGLNLTMTGHLLATGNYIVNVTRDDAIRQVIAVPDADNVTLDSTVTSQTVGDVIDQYNGTSISTTFSNIGDVTIKPQLQIQKIGTGNIVITNTTNGNQELAFNSLVNGEYVYIDCANEIILSDQTGIYRYTSMTVTSQFLEMVYGTNNLTLEGDFNLQFQYFLKTMQG